MPMPVSPYSMYSYKVLANIPNPFTAAANAPVSGCSCYVCQYGKAGTATPAQVVAGPNGYAYPAPRQLGGGQGESFRPFLRQGAGSAPQFGGCLMQVVSNLADAQAWTDAAPGVDVYLRSLGITLNDSLDDVSRQALLAYAPRMLGTQTDLAVSARAWLLAASRRVAEHESSEYPGHWRAEGARQTAQRVEDWALSGRHRERAGAPLADLDATVTGSLTVPPLGGALGRLQGALKAYERGMFPLACSEALGAACATGLGASVLGAVLDARELVLGAPRWRSLEDVPGQVWARMERSVMGLAA